MTLTEIKKELTHSVTEYDRAVQNVKKESKLYKKAKKQLKWTKEAQQVGQELAQSLQQKAHSQITNIVTRCLQLVLGDDSATFDIQFEQKRGKTEANIMLLIDGAEFSLLDDSAGGELDIVSFACQLSAIMLSRPPVRRLMVLDEPFRHVSKDHRGRVSAMLETLAEELDMQFIMVTHDPEYHIGKTIRMEM